MRIPVCLAALVGGASLAATAACAHVTLAVKEAPIGADYKAVFRVPHGCKGSATIKLSVQIPPGVIAVKPQPKPGWQIEITKGPYDQPYQHGGSNVSEGVKVVSWSGGHLPDDYYDEFVLSAYLDRHLEPETRLYFPTVQTCEQGVERWIEIPTAGKTPNDYRSPAPSVKLLPAMEHTD